VARAASASVEVFADLRADVGEAPHWDERTKTLLFVDLTGGAVHGAQLRLVVTAQTYGDPESDPEDLPERAWIVLIGASGLPRASTAAYAEA
jgi:sugar lactone lactonase YvrE